MLGSRLVPIEHVIVAECKVLFPAVCHVTRYPVGEGLFDIGHLVAALNCQVAARQESLRILAED